MKEFIIYKTFKIQYINHPHYGLKYQYVAEDILFEDITTDLETFATAEDLDYGEAMIHFMDGNTMVITRDRDLKIPAVGNPKW